jgi:hypothetical protein
MERLERNRMIRLACTAAATLLTHAAMAESDIDLRGSVGYDSNVFDLNPIVGVQGGMFTEASAVVEGVGLAEGGWTKRADIGFSGRLYESALSDGNEARLYVRARASSNEAYGDNGWEWSLRYQARDKTYVSQLTGVEATFGGEPIGDRYDRSGGDFKAGWRLPGGSLGRLSLAGWVRDQQYWEDYEELGLDRLDYHEYGLGPTYEIGDRDRGLEVALRAEKRIYADRRVSDANGDPVPGTDREYDYYGVDARLRHRFTRRIALEANGGYEIREDNGVGYDDRTRWNAGIEIDLRLPGSNRLSLATTYYSRQFDNQVVGDPTINDELPDKEGFESRLRYQRPFPFVDIRGFTLFVEASFESYDNTRDERYVYDRTVGYLGVRKDF